MKIDKILETNLTPTGKKWQKIKTVVGKSYNKIILERNLWVIFTNFLGDNHSPGIHSPD